MGYARFCTMMILLEGTPIGLSKLINCDECKKYHQHCILAEFKYRCLFDTMMTIALQVKFGLQFCIVVWCQVFTRESRWPGMEDTDCQPVEMTESQQLICITAGGCSTSLDFDRDAISLCTSAKLKYLCVSVMFVLFHHQRERRFLLPNVVWYNNHNCDRLVRTLSELIL